MDWTKVPKSHVIPNGLYHLRIYKYESKMSTARPEENKKSKVMDVLMFQVVPHPQIPSSYHKKVFTDWFVLGTEDCPDEPVASALGTIDLTNVYRAAHVDLNGDHKEVGELAVGCEFVGRVTQQQFNRGARNHLGEVMTLDEGQEHIGLDDADEDNINESDELVVAAEANITIPMHGYHVPVSLATQFAVCTTKAKQKAFAEKHGLESAE